MFNTALIIFAREPVAGRVKTRLASKIGPDLAVRLYKLFLQDVLTVASSARIDGRFLYIAGQPEETKSYFDTCRKNIIVKRQRGADLGARMLQALVEVNKLGFDRMVIIGTDCLTISAMEIEQAFRHLERCHVVLGPCRDGGYYLIGCRAAQPEIFSGIPWGTDLVLAQTVCRIRKAGLTSRLLHKKQDIDTLTDLRRYVRKAAVAKVTGKTADYLLANQGKIFYTKNQLVNARQPGPANRPERMTA